MTYSFRKVIKIYHRLKVLGYLLSYYQMSKLLDVNMSMYVYINALSVIYIYIFQCHVVVSMCPTSKDLPCSCHSPVTCPCLTHVPCPCSYFLGYCCSSLSNLNFHLLNDLIWSLISFQVMSSQIGIYSALEWSYFNCRLQFCILDF